MKQRLLFALLALSAVPPVHATHGNGGSEGGNGGGGEVEFIALRGEVSLWIQDRLADGTLSKKLRLGQAGISSPDFYAAYQKAVDTPVIFQDSPLELEGYSTAPKGRICANSGNPARIECNLANWATSSPQIKFAIVLHEVLGVAGLEKNQGEYSRYPISSAIIGYLHRSDKFEIGIKPDYALEVRERYDSAVRPSQEELLGKVYLCNSYPLLLFNTALPGMPGSLSFGPDAEHPESLQMITQWDTERLYPRSVNNLPDWGYNKLWRKFDTAWRVYVAIRIEKSSQKLLIETSSENPVTTYGIPYLSSISVFPSAKVMNYGECKLGTDEARPQNRH